MLVKLAYGRKGLTVDFPAGRTTVIEPTYTVGISNQMGAVQESIRNPIGTSPLRSLVRPDQKVAISVCDITRPMPRRVVLPVLLQELSHIPTENITLLIATGTHRGNSTDERLAMFGREIVEHYQIVNHDAFDRSGLTYLGESVNVPVWINSRWIESDVRITTGFVEPHFFAGFSGGPKMVAPGLAGFDTTMHLHNAKMIAHPNATWAVTEGNPIHDAVRRIAELSRVDFSVDVTINRDHELTGVFAGELFSTHRKACATVKNLSMKVVDHPFDIVVTTNSGYPLDQNLYQTVKGMSAAAQIVKEGGAILCASECSDGIPSHGGYEKVLMEGRDPRELLNLICAPGHNIQDQWEVQIQAQIQLKADVCLKSDGLTPEQIHAAHLRSISDIGQATKDYIGKFGPNASVCVLPQGPLTIPYLSTTP